MQGMDVEVRQLMGAAVRSYDQARNAAFRRFNAAISQAMGMDDDGEARALMDGAWRVYVDEMQEAGAPMSMMVERLAR